MKTKKIIMIIILIIFLIFSIYFFINKRSKNIYEFNGNKFSYSNNRDRIQYEIIPREILDNVSINNLSYYSMGVNNEKIKIFGLLFLPKDKKNVPGIVYLPGAGATKESRYFIATTLSKEGYAVLVIDQRGIGETGGLSLSYEEDYKVFSSGKVPIQHLSVFDALRAFDLLRDIKAADKNNIAVIGESMGGRYAIIAASIDKRIKGAVSVSSSGFNFKYNPMSQQSIYILSIDPDNYVEDISPNYLFMLHGNNDSIIPLDNAKNTYNKAKEPKRFFIGEGCGHGYCDEKMREELLNDLKLMFE